MVLAEGWSSACGANTLSPCAPLLWSVFDVRLQRHQIQCPERWSPPCSVQYHKHRSLLLYISSLNLIKTIEKDYKLETNENHYTSLFKPRCDCVLV